MSIISASTTSTTAYKVTADTTGTLVLQTGSTPTTAVTIDTSQNVGIGTASPAYKLDVSGTANAAAVNTTLAYGTSGEVYSSFRFSNSSFSGGNSEIRNIVNGAGSTGSALALFTTQTGTSTLTERLRIDNSGNVGVGTTSPSTYGKFVAYSSGGYFSVDSNGQTISAQLLDLATAGGRFSGYSSRGLLGAIKIEQATTGADGGYMAFGTCASGSTTYTERARITSSGDFYVGANAGTATGAYIATGAFYATNATAAAANLQCWNQATSGNNTFLSFYTEGGGGALRGSIIYSRGAGVVVYNTTSDYRAKTVNGPVENALTKVAALKPCTGRMNGAESDIDFFVAHELQEVVPSAVTGEKDAVKEDGTPDYQMVDKSALIPLLTAAIQEQQAIIETLTNRITALEAK